MELKELTPHLDSIREEMSRLFGELKTVVDQKIEAVKATGSVPSELKEKQDRLEVRMDQLQAQALRSDADPSRAQQIKSTGAQFVESDIVKAAKASNFGELTYAQGRIRADAGDIFMARKANITTVGMGSGTTGVQMPQRLPGITGLPVQDLRVPDLMKKIKMTSGNSFDYVRMLARTNAPSPQVEAAAKAESTYTWESKSDTIKTIAHFTNVSRQAIDDMTWLEEAINTELMYGLMVKVEAEILAGSGTGQHLNGLITQATARASTYDVAGDTKLDRLRHAKLQARLIGLSTFAPDGLVLHPKDMHDIELIKTEEGAANKGRYIVGDPQQGTAVKYIWGLPTVESDAISSGTFLLGAFGTAATIIDRMAAMIELSYEHANNFTANLVTILAETRLGLAVRRPDAFITGTFT